ncbi:MAG TPA: methyltransferase domain-containing protein [Candidatus Ozemobacteraceae bacterium]|nr:methyltransferase domain-containing protein [Candidatus Ozemobacteraceae bacterium]
MTDIRRRFFERLAEEDTEYFAVRPDQEPVLARLWELLGPLDGHRVFEPGCGAGHFTERLASRVGPTGQIHSCDSSRNMIEAAQRRLKCFRTVRTYLADAERAEAFPTEPIDLVLAFRFFPHLTDRRTFLERARNLVQPTGGRLVLAHLEDSATLNGIHADAGGAVQDDRLPPPSRMRDLLAQTGWQTRHLSDTPETGFVAIATPL